MKRIVTLLIAVALLVGMGGCGEVIDNGDGNGNGPVLYELTLSSTSGGSVVEPGEGVHTYEEGTVVDLVAEADEGYRFVNWTGDTGTIADTNAASTTITMNGDYSITANFDDTPPVQYELIISSTAGGSVTTPGEGTFTYDAGTVVDIVAEAKAGYRFMVWDGDVESIADVDAPSTMVTIKGDYSIRACFLEVTEIWDWYDLDAIRDNLDGDYILMTDLDLTTAGYDELAGPAANDGRGWEPIGYSYYEVAEWVSEPFTGTFNGQGHEIGELFINRPEERSVGLFGGIMGGVIGDVGVISIDVTGGWHVGALIGLGEHSLVTNSYSSGIVRGEREVGGLVGNSYDCMVDDSHSNVSVTSDSWDVGGLIGVNGGNLRNSYFTGSVAGGPHVGGLVGTHWSGSVDNSYYSLSEVLINGENVITIGALSSQDFDEWLANDKFLDINDRLVQQDGFYVINTMSDLKELLAFGQDASLRFSLKNDLDLSTASNFYIPYLAGEFDGNGYRISNLSVTSAFISMVGLFGYLDHGAIVSNVGVYDVSVAGYAGVGGLIGVNRGGTVSASYASGSVAGEWWGVGGLMGDNWEGTVSNCHFTGSVIGYGHVGGLVGQNTRGTVTDSCSTANVTGQGQAGGLVGTNQGNVTNSCFDGTVTASNAAGGLIGANFPGNGWGTVSNSYSAGSVTGEFWVGGLVGSNHGGTVIINCYSTCSVAGTTAAGGLVGRNLEGTVTNSFWDTETSGQPTSDGGTGKTTTQMKSLATFSDVGTEGLDEPWDIVAVSSGESNPAHIWNIVDGQTYPFLSWQTVS